MTLAEMLPQELAKSNHLTAGRQTHELADDCWSLKLVNERTESLGSSIWELDLSRQTPSDQPVPVGDWARGVASRATGLLEPLKVLEVDTEREEAVLRSDGPTARDDERHYYEVRLQGDSEASLRRYKGNRSGGPREQLPFTLTHEVLAKLIQDITRQSS